MDRDTLIFQMERYLNGVQDSVDVDCDFGTSAAERFILNTGKRLRNAWILYRREPAYKDDFLLALRDYLIVMETDLHLPDHCVPEYNDYSIVKDMQKGTFFATLELPETVNRKFVERAFLIGNNSPQRKESGTHYNLQSDPFIYKLTGYSEFKSIEQKIAVHGALRTPEGYTTLVSLPTGGGKSLITQTISYQDNGLTIVIVPTISLAIDQVRAAKKVICSEQVEKEVFCYHSGENPTPILLAIQQKTARMLFISPEALLNNKIFVEGIRKANAERYLKNIVIDEAHIVVDWGSQFRVDYQCLESWRRLLLQSNPSIRTFLLSATYEKRSIDILKNLFSQGGKWIEVRCDALCHEPHYILINAKSYTDKKKKMLELVRKLPHPMIIYVARPEDAEKTKDVLKNAGLNNVETFTGLTNGRKREELIQGWIDDKFEIMVATSAFGVGVDKSDVRTVLHLYIPPNPNAYYQELGRGGRDGLPCLSVMCVDPDDSNIAFQRINKKVLTSKKIVGRWNSMYNSATSPRKGNYAYIDTSVKPEYNIQKDELEDTPASEADTNWNIYVLLLLRRNNLIRIQEVIPQGGLYTFVIEVLDERLLDCGQEQEQLIETIRQKEWDYYEGALKTIQLAVRNYKKVCWSEMFYDTYDKVSEYCAGCDKHVEPINGDTFEFALKSAVQSPLRPLLAEQTALLGGAKDAIVYVQDENRAALVDALLKKGLSVLIVKDRLEGMNALSNCENVLILNEYTLTKLVQKNNWYYLSGLIGVLYQGTPSEIYEELRIVSNRLSGRPETGIVHIIAENRRFDWMDKSFSDLVEGPVLSLQTILNG